MSDVAWFIFFFFNDTATTEIYTLSLHDALPISSLFAQWSALRTRFVSLHAARATAETTSVMRGDRVDGIMMFRTFR